MVRAGAVSGGLAVAGGGGYFLWTATDAPEDHGTVIVPTGSSGYAWVRVNTTDHVPLSWFELDASGAIDCTAQINAVLSLAKLATAVPAAGDPWPATCNAIVLLPPGSFLYAGTESSPSLTLGSSGGIHIRGCGSGNTTLLCNSVYSSESPGFLADAITITQPAASEANPDPSSNVTIEGIKIDSGPARLGAGNGGTAVYPDGILMSGIRITPPSGATGTVARVRLRDVVIQNQPGHGIIGLAPELVDMEMVTCQNNGADGFCFLQSGSESDAASGVQNVFSLCQATGNQYRGFCLPGINSSTFFNCTSSGNLLAASAAGNSAFPGNNPGDETWVQAAHVQEEAYCSSGPFALPQLNTFYNCMFLRSDGPAQGFTPLTLGGLQHAVVGGKLSGSRFQIVLGASASKVAGVYFTGFAATESPASDSGTAGSGSNTTTLVDGSKDWSSSWVGATVALTSGPNVGAWAIVTGSTATALTFVFLPLSAGAGYVVTFASVAAIAVNSSDDLIQNCLIDGNDAMLFLNSPNSGLTVISNGIMQTYAARGGTYSTSVSPNATSWTPDPLNNGREQYVTINSSLTIETPENSAPGRRLTLVFTQSDAFGYSTTFAPSYHVSVPEPASGPGTPTQVWVCDLVCDGQNWIQTNPQAAWVKT